MALPAAALPLLPAVALPVLPAFEICLRCIFIYIYSIINDVMKLAKHVVFMINAGVFLRCNVDVCVMLNAHLPTENRGSSVSVYQTQTRSSAFVGAIPPIQNMNRR